MLTREQISSWKGEEWASQIEEGDEPEAFGITKVDRSEYQGQNYWVIWSEGVFHTIDVQPGIADPEEGEILWRFGEYSQDRGWAWGKTLVRYETQGAYTVRQMKAYQERQKAEKEGWKKGGEYWKRIQGLRKPFRQRIEYLKREDGKNWYGGSGRLELRVMELTQAIVSWCEGKEDAETTAEMVYGEELKKAEQEQFQGVEGIEHASGRGARAAIGFAGQYLIREFPDYASATKQLKALDKKARSARKAAKEPEENHNS